MKITKIEDITDALLKEATASSVVDFIAGSIGRGNSHRPDETSDHALKDGVIGGDGFGGRGGQKGGLGQVSVASEDGLAMVEDQGEVALLQRAELKEKAVVLFEAELFPLVRVHPMEKRSSGVMGNLFQNGEQGVGVGFEHCYTNE